MLDKPGESRWIPTPRKDWAPVERALRDLLDLPPTAQIASMEAVHDPASDRLLLRVVIQNTL